LIGMNSIRKPFLNGLTKPTCFPMRHNEIIDRAARILRTLSSSGDEHAETVDSAQFVMYGYFNRTR
jgi:hypothetical protein